MAASSVVRLVRNSPSYTLLAALAVLISRGKIKIPKVVAYAYAMLLILNWPNLPLMWHWRVLSPIYLRFIPFRISRALGRWTSQKRIFTDYVGSKEVFPYVGKPIFVNGGTYFKGTVGFAELDFFGHMSNTIYGQLADRSRSVLAFTAFAPLLRVQEVYLPLAGMQYCFFKEIRLGQNYEVESRTLTFDDRWFWAITRVTISKYAKKRGRPSADILVKTLTGERVLCCIMVSRHCFKLPGVPGCPLPARVYSLIGLSPTLEEDMTNWESGKKILAKGKKAIVEHLMDPDRSKPTGMEACEEHRAKVHDALQRLGDGGDKQAWMELNNLATGAV